MMSDDLCASTMEQEISGQKEGERENPEVCPSQEDEEYMNSLQKVWSDIEAGSVTIMMEIGYFLAIPTIFCSIL